MNWMVNGNGMAHASFATGSDTYIQVKEKGLCVWKAQDLPLENVLIFPWNPWPEWRILPTETSKMSGCCTRTGHKRTICAHQYAFLQAAAALWSSQITSVWSKAITDRNTTAHMLHVYRWQGARFSAIWNWLWPCTSTTIRHIGKGEKRDCHFWED